ncbi:hypothetical protein [Georgenia yuyongxinii]
MIELLARLPVVATDADLVLRAVATAGRHQLSVWDALIVEAGAEAGCTQLWTEELVTGSTLRGVRIGDPFDDRPSRD